MFDFPSLPNSGDLITNGSAAYQFDGRAWVVKGSFPAVPPPIITGPGTLTNVGGVLVVSDALWPVSTTGLTVGALWNNGGLASVSGVTTPNPTAPAVVFGNITSSALLALGGANLPLSSPTLANQLWNNGGVVSIAPGAAMAGGLANNTGVLNVSDAAWPVSATGLFTGALWSNNGVASVVGTTTPNPTAPPVYLSNVTSTTLLALGGTNLPLTSPMPTGSGQLWNNGGVVCVA